jgi:cell division septum initiation protein DivIVA
MMVLRRPPVSTPSRLVRIGSLAVVLIFVSDVLASAADVAPAAPAESSTSIIDQIETDAARAADKAAELGDSAAKTADEAADAAAEEADSLFEQAKKQGKRAYEWSKEKLDELF